MFRNHPKTVEVFVVTSPGNELNTQELCDASDLNTQRYFAAREMCPKAGECALKSCYEKIDGGEEHNRVDRYFIDCNGDCALLIRQDDEPYINQ